MSMLEWAEREIEIACKRERGDKPEGEWDYGVACYESAMEAFKVLLGQGHSGISIKFTQGILNRLIDGKPLSPIEDTEDVWEFAYEKENGKVYQCNRMSSLFKNVDKDGSVSYSDNDRCCCVDIDSGSAYHSGLIRKVVDDMFPITMPYMPKGTPIKVYCEDFLVDPKNGDYDTVGIFYQIMPDGEKKELNLFFKDGEDDMVAIDKEEYMRRKENQVERK